MSREEHDLISESEKLCAEVRASLRDEIFVSKIELLKDNFDKLQQKHQELDRFVADLALVIDSFDNSPRPVK